MNFLFMLLLCLGQQMQPVNTPPSSDPLNPLPVKGSIEYHGVQRVVNLWGTHYEMGYAHGYLLGDEIMYGFEEKFLGGYTKPSSYQSKWLPYTLFYFQLAPDYKQELKGMLDGIKAKGVNLYSTKLAREIGFDDLHALNLIADLKQVAGCSSSFGWGKATLDDPELKGGSVMVRNNDGPVDPFGWVQTHCIIYVYQSSSPDEKGFISLMWPGLIGVSTGFNVDGVGVADHNGNYIGFDPNATPAHSIYGWSLSIRDGLENKDYDGDGYETHMDVYHSVSSHISIAAIELGMISPYPVPGYPGMDAAAILEVNYWKGFALRDATHHNWFNPPLNSCDLLAVTNHHRLLYTPIPCYRYQHQVNKLSIDFKVDTDELWDIQSGIAFNYTQIMAAFRPNLRDMFVAFNETMNGAHNSQKNYYKLADLFPNH